MASCGTPPAITGGTVITSGPYADGSTAQYQCTNNYVMVTSSSYITCLNGVLDGSVICQKQGSSSTGSIGRNGVVTTTSYGNNGSCNTPPAITGGTVINSGPYVNASIALYQCSEGYMSSVTCLNGVWDGSTSCTIQDTNNISVGITNNFDNYDLPIWLIYITAAAVILLVLSLLTCLLVWCCQLRRSCPRRVFEIGRRLPTEDRGRSCYSSRNNTANNANVTSSPVAKNPNDTTLPRPPFSVQDVTEVLVETRNTPAKEIKAWRPRTVLVKSVKTRTK